MRMTLVILLGLIISGIAALLVPNPFSARSPEPLVMSYAELTGSIFLPSPRDPFRAPQVRELPLPAFDNATSVWGALGRDPQGHIWVGVSAANAGMSAHLFEYDPATDAWRDHGGVLAQLKAAGLLRENQGQIKIHSRIVTASDGWLYFASSDEEGEDPGTGALPRWGGHLWRMHPVDHYWQHLLAVPEGLVAVSGVGRYVYALGYWGHILYQYDTATREVKRIAVGSVDGHVSRNFLSDIRGHAYVPRVAKRSDGTVYDAYRPAVPDRTRRDRQSRGDRRRPPPPKRRRVRAVAVPMGRRLDACRRRAARRPIRVAGL
jgi:hypothetical protein